MHIHNLRDKVGKARIRTVRGFGYMLVANEERIESDAFSAPTNIAAPTADIDHRGHFVGV